MAINTNLSEDGKTVTWFINGRFDFSSHRDFLKAFNEHPKGEKSFVVDLKNAEYMDSSAMGMLLQLRDHSNKESQVVISNANEGVSEILRIANFDKLFDLQAGD